MSDLHLNGSELHLLLQLHFSGSPELPNGAIHSLARRANPKGQRTREGRKKISNEETYASHDPLLLEEVLDTHTHTHTKENQVFQ